MNWFDLLPMPLEIEDAFSTLDLHVVMASAVLDFPIRPGRDSASKAPPLPPEQLKCVLELGIGPERHFPKETTVQDLFTRQAMKSPTSVAVACGARSINYEELDRLSNKVCRYLQRRGVQNGIVGICLDRSIEMVIALLGILKSGCAYLPLDSSFPPDRLRSMIEDSHASAVISQSNLSSLFFGERTTHSSGHRRGFHRGRISTRAPSRSVFG